MTNAPPKLARRLLLSFLRDDLAEEVLGDLDEKFYSTARKKSLFRAKVNYWYQVLNYARPFAIKRLRVSNYNQYDMFRNHLTVGWRNLFRNSGYSLINIGGLALGMAIATLIGLWVYDELNFNHYHNNYKYIGKVMRAGSLNGEIYTTSYLPFALSDELKSEYGANFKQVVTAWPLGDHIISSGDKKISLPGQFIEPAAPEMFSFKMLHGNYDGLQEPASILLSSSAAKSFFGDKDPLNETLLIDNRMEVKVAGVYDDLPYNAHFYGVKFFAPWELFVSYNPWTTTQGFTNNFLYIYVEIQPSTDFETASRNIRNAILSNVSHIKEYAAVNPQVFLHPMEKWHLYGEWTNGVAGGRIQYVWLFGVTGVLVLLLACINFMNLSTARSEKRSKEVSIRKTIGSAKWQLVSQFFTESFLFVLISFCVSLLVVIGSMNGFNLLADKKMSIPWTNPGCWIASLLFVLITGLLAGSYPALYLSSFRPLRLLKGGSRAGRLSSVPRRALVVLQFAVSVSLAIGTLVVYQQIRFAKDRPVGYKSDGLIMVQMTSGDFAGKYELLRTSLKATGAVSEMALSNGPVTSVWSSNGGFDWKGKDPDFQMDFATLSITPEYGKTVGWNFTKGRDFSPDLASDSSGVIINESAARILGFDDPIGEVIRWKPVWASIETQFTVLGVIKDMVMESPYSPSMPTVFFLAPNYNWINIRIDPSARLTEAIPKIESVFKTVVPSVPFDFQFADQAYALKFAAEERIGKLALLFSILAVFISCLGLFGLASFVAEQRTKEIGIRKVVGASVFSLWKMLSKDFVFLVMIGCLLAIPPAYYVLHNWLQGFEYRTEIPLAVFVLVIAGAVMITLLTVSYQAIRAALMNPVRSLRSE